MKPHRFSLAAALPTIVLASLIVGSDSRGQTTEWQLAGSGSWFDSDNWTLGEPSSTKNAEINNGGTAELLSATGDARIVYLGRNLNSSGTLNVVSGVLDSGGAYVGHTGSGTATVQGTNSIWTTSSDLRVGYQGTGQLNVTLSGEVDSPRGLIGDVGGATGVATVNGTGSKWTNAGELFVGNQGTGTLNVQSGGLVTTSNGYVGRLAYASSTGTANVTGAGSKWTISDYYYLYVGYEGAGALNIDDGGAVESFRGYIGHLGGSTGMVTVDGADSSWTNNDVLVVGYDGTGTLNIRNGGSVSADISFVGQIPGSTGMVTVDGAGSTWTNNDIIVVGGIEVEGIYGTGTLNVQNGGIVSSADVEGMSIAPHGTVRGNGTIIANVTNNGVVAPGTSPGTLHITGNYTQAAAGELQIELASAGNYDKLDVFDNAAFGGTLELSLIGGYTPQAGSSFDILDWGSRSGTFSSIQLPTLGPGLSWEPSQLYISGLLSVVSAGLTGDFNHDSTVDAADYVVWRKTGGSSDDYNTWWANFGASLGAGSGSTMPFGEPLSPAVPEPATFVLLIFAAAGWCLRRGQAA